MTIRISVVDDQDLVLRGICELLQDEPDFDVVGAHLDGASLLTALPETDVDVVVMDVRMPAMSGVETLARMRQDGFETPVLILTTFDDHELLLSATEAGAQGFMLKDSRPEDLAAAIRVLHDGGRHLEPMSPEGVRRHQPYAAPPVKASLSAREREVLRLMAGGYSNREIAKALFLAEGTVKNYVSEILAKLDCRDRTRAVLKAVTLHLF